MTFTVADLQAALATLPSDMPVVLAKDAGGNDGSSPLATAGTALYLAENTYSGEWFPTEEQRLAQDDPDAYWPAPEGAVPALFLWPTN